MKNRTPNILMYLFPSLGAVIWIGVFFGVLSLGHRMMNLDGDLGRHLVVGGYILDHGVIPLRDLFSHTLFGQPFTPHEWLAEIIFTLFFRLLGLNGIILVSALVISTAFWLVFIRLRAESKFLLPALLVVFLAIAASSLHWLTRPHLFTFLLLALWMIVLFEMRRGKLQFWWLLPVLMLIWANLHGAFIAGFLTWLIYGVGLGWDVFWGRFQQGKELYTHFWRYYVLGGAAAFLTSLINPSGVGLWKTSIGYIGNQYLVNHTMEYLSPNFHDPGTWPFLLFIGLLVMVLGLKNKKIESEFLFTAASWLLIGLYSTRNIPLFAIVAAPLLSQGLEDIFYDSPHQFKFVNRLQELDARLLKIDLGRKGIFWPVACICIAVVAFRAGIRFDINQKGNAFDPQVFPVDAVNWLDNHPQKGEMFNYFTWGGYLLYRLWPDKLVFIDGQTDFYGEDFTRQYEKVITMSTGWENVLDLYHVDWIILPRGEAIVQSFRTSLDWATIYEDNTSVIIRRKN